MDSCRNIVRHRSGIAALITWSLKDGKQSSPSRTAFAFEEELICGKHLVAVKEPCLFSVTERTDWSAMSGPFAEKCISGAPSITGRVNADACRHRIHLNICYRP